MQYKIKKNSVIIYSSARREGNTSAHANSYAEQNDIRVICLDDYKIPPYCYSKNYKNDDFYTVFESLLDYEHWIFASPVYWYNTTVQMKSFIDRITDYMDDENLKPKLRALRTKEFSLLSNASSFEAPDAFVQMFKQTFGYLGMRFVSHSHKNTQSAA
ncbi:MULTISPECIES: flavodoxin family protein [Pseudoalteromonas]|uniref:FMN reductase n=1 Tax=Pseudoalteromonas fuliginea TaxID=1872678 RepID=A0ABD3YDL7_9GAMM|nr:MULTISPECIES: flavodoxin family protein [Pseudoalteromonas]ALQ09927.1 FMN reductase [Pseudoalteromonas sp. Bsw20308]ATG79582.1 FMN reductase [Pseudoalteromonas sp. 1_2015MBL_MicDiv]KDC53117.1 FMN reductase [Pseudoalteromonas fuliginea]KJZ29235.1 FMN reductase [Pseudoalteromonas fuliginea]